MKVRILLPRTFDPMKKNVFLWIVVINSLALAGIIVTQLFWIGSAYRMLDEQFAGSVRVALKSVVNQIHDVESLITSNAASQDIMISYQPDIMNINSEILEKKIKEELLRMNINRPYEYAIIDTRTDSLIFGKYGHKQALVNSAHNVNLVGFKDCDKYILAAWFPSQKKIIVEELARWIIVWVVFVTVLIIGFPVSIYIFNRQKRLSGMKSDFINNMTHEFKTPIATMSLASEMLLKKPVSEDPERLRRYARIINDENTRLQNHVEQILSVSRLERGLFKLKKRETDIHLLIREVVENFSLTIRERNGTIKTHLIAKRFIVNVDKSHLTNVINNLLDNANKYSVSEPWISIGTQSTENGLTIIIEDHGIGISLENQRQVFKNLYRVPTGNIYNVKGFGIGLYYVKTIVEAHGGHINLKSELNKGSRFDVYLPFDYKSTRDEQYNQA